MLGAAPLTQQRAAELRGSTALADEHDARPESARLDQQS
jgi:hypothetical protein